MVNSFPWFIVLTSVIGGFALGAITMMFWSPRLKSNKDIAEKLAHAEKELEEYREKVTSHFSETSKLVNNLTQSYRDVHEHLAQSAMTLTTPTISQQFSRQLESPVHAEYSLEEESPGATDEPADEFDEAFDEAMEEREETATRTPENTDR